MTTTTNQPRPMKQYRITFTDCGEPDSTVTRGHDADHALERFWGSLLGGPEGIRVQTVTRYLTPAERIARKYNRNRAKP